MPAGNRLDLAERFQNPWACQIPGVRSKVEREETGSFHNDGCVQMALLMPALEAKVKQQMMEQKRRRMEVLIEIDCQALAAGQLGRRRIPS